MKLGALLHPAAALFVAVLLSLAKLNGSQVEASSNAERSDGMFNPLCLLDPRDIFSHRVRHYLFVVFHQKLLLCFSQIAQRQLQSPTSSTTFDSRRVSWHWGDIFDSSNLEL
jgi:hypothetical protein